MALLNNMSTTRERSFPSFAFLLIIVFFDSCAPALTTHVFVPTKPHLVLTGNDTIYARSGIVKDRFLAPKVIVDDTIFNKNRLLYAHTDWGHRYFMIHNKMTEQLVSGKIDVFSNAINAKQNKPWRPNDSGVYAVRTIRPEYVRKLPSNLFLKPDDRTLFSLVSDYSPARLDMQRAMRMRSLGIGSAITSAVFSGAGVMLFVLSAFDHSNPDGELMQTIGLSSMATGALIFSFAFPSFMIRYKRLRITAIDTYNRGDF